MGSRSTTQAGRDYLAYRARKLRLQIKRRQKELRKILGRMKRTKEPRARKTDAIPTLHEAKLHARGNAFHRVHHNRGAAGRAEASRADTDRSSALVQGARALRGAAAAAR